MYKLFHNPPMIIGLSFLFVILFGAVLLNMPEASISGERIGFVNALFTASSATCVTGLIVVNTASYFSVMGKAVILVLIQIGGMGTMVLFSLIAMLFNFKIGLKERILIKEQLNQDTLTGLVKLTKSVIKISLFIELVGAIVLSIRFIPIYGMEKGIAFSVFHSISAFCNAGFDIIGNSLMSYPTDLILNLTISILIILGGLGFTVFRDILRKKSIRHTSLHTKMVLIVTSILLVIGTILFYLIENEGTLANYVGTEKWLISFFQSTISRTAGFNSVDMASVHYSTAVILMILMFIGGSPASTAGGLKTTTFGVILATTISVCKGERDVVFLKRTIPRDTVSKAIAIAVIYLGAVIIATLLITIVEVDKFNLLDVLFESISAFATVGISRGITPELSTASKIIITVSMYLGRVGPATLAVAIMKSRKTILYKYAEGDIVVG